MKSFLVVGAGISGLVTAWSLRQAGHAVTVLEAASAPGGTMHSVDQDGYRLDLGPNTVLDRSGAVRTLAESVGIGGQVMEADPSAARRYIAKDGRLLALPTDPVAFFKTPIFSLRGKLRLLIEPFKGRARTEETIAAFVRRRLGPEFLDWAVDPFVSGVYAGDPDRLSVRAATAKIYALESEHGSLLVGALARGLRRRPAGPTPRGKLISFRDGVQGLAHGVAAALGEAVHTGAEVAAIAPRARGGWAVETAAATQHEADHLVLSVPASDGARLLEPLDAGLAAALRAIPYAPVACIALGYPREAVRHPLDGFGVLIPRRLGLRTLGCLFSSTLFDQRAPHGRVLLTAFVGGARHTEVATQSPHDLVRTVVPDLCPLLGLEGEPEFVRVHIWKQAIPQYEIGHLARIEEIERGRMRLGPLHFVANWRGGISVADCVENATAFPDQLVTY